MPCSAVTLSLATISAIVAAALLSIAFSTDNWVTVDVDRDNIKSINSRKKINGPDEGRRAEKIRDRVIIQTYLSPVETHCMNIDYYIPDVDDKTKNFTDDAMTRLHMGRSMIALFILSFIAVFTAFWTGVVGCWKRSAANTTATAIIMLFACLFSAGAMGLWHGVEYYEKEKVVGEEFFQQWPTILKENTVTAYDWSYFIAWVGVVFSLLSAILFSGAAICLRGEREKEEAMNMQYLMPVYPQKQQFGYPGYPAPYFPGPQYGPGPGAYSY